ncbi:hypothetical protein GpSGHVEth057 [Glossina pallidipes salivary gland hypertrophy virus]|uniref:Uncharacterized protein n=1 Tax=Glossina hytrovirus (isolate Glossina pallidipes/Ethiopia/Seibersdorf/-) TaxID=379529 RepID=A0A0Y0KFS9_GHVS|nr:hypothetical protein GpSGHVEth057 [Glossina pallidipes salivary gland hypertrophy virus]
MESCKNFKPPTISYLESYINYLQNLQTTKKHEILNNTTEIPSANLKWFKEFYVGKLQCFHAIADGNNNQIIINYLKNTKLFKIYSDIKECNNEKHCHFLFILNKDNLDDFSRLTNILTSDKFFLYEQIKTPLILLYTLYFFNNENNNFLHLTLFYPEGYNNLLRLKELIPSLDINFNNVQLYDNRGEPLAFTDNESTSYIYLNGVKIHLDVSQKQ